MVEVEKYIKRLLYDQDCVIIPGFGSVLTHYTPAHFDQGTGTYLPSERKVAFNEVLKIDDGLLTKFISENEGLSYQQAKSHIDDFVQTAHSLIRKNRTITLNGIGNFHLNGEGRIVFQPDESRNFHPEFFGLRAVQVSTPAPSVLEMEEEAVLTPVVDKEPLTETPVAEVRKIAWGNWVSAACIAGILVYVSAVLSNEPGATSSSLNPVEFMRALFVSSAESRTVEVQPKSMVAGASVVEVEEEVAVVDNVIEEVEPITVAEVGASKKYHLIASVYESPASLEKYGKQLAEKLKAEGYESVATLPLREKYMLSAGSFDSWHEARKALPALNKTAKGAWIYKEK